MYQIDVYDKQADRWVAWSADDTGEPAVFKSQVAAYNAAASLVHYSNLNPDHVRVVARSA